jgi:hypothetical protein
MAAEKFVTVQMAPVDLVQELTGTMTGMVLTMHVTHMVVDQGKEGEPMVPRKRCILTRGSCCEHDEDKKKSDRRQLHWPTGLDA